MSIFKKKKITKQEQEKNLKDLIDNELDNAVYHLMMHPKTLGDKQRLFVMLVGKLIDWAYKNGFELSFGDAYAKTGHMKGSLHYDRLAIDLNLFIGGKYQKTSEAHKPLGDYWKTLHPKCRWGGDFRPKKDGNHYSFEYRGKA